MIRAWCQRRPGCGHDKECTFVDVTAMGRPNYHEYDHPALEGGDLLVLGQAILAGTSMNTVMGSSAAGVAWLATMLGPQGYTVERVPIGNEIGEPGGDRTRDPGIMRSKQAVRRVPWASITPGQRVARSTGVR